MEETVPLITSKTYPLFPIPRPVKRYRHSFGEYVHFRMALGKLNNDVMEPVVERLGHEPLLVMEVGDGDQVHIWNETDGEEDVVHGIWLIPASVSHEQDYPSS